MVTDELTNDNFI